MRAGASIGSRRDRRQRITANLIGCYLLGLAGVAVLAVPKSGFWAILLLAPVLIGAGRFW